MPGKVVLKLDRRMIPEENSTEVEATAVAASSRRRPGGAWHPRST